jgi:hypothetical protein
VLDAVRCAVEIQEELKVRNAELPEDRKMEFRIGVSLADVALSRGTKGVIMEFRDGEELFHQKVREFTYLWDRARPVDLESD